MIRKELNEIKSIISESLVFPGLFNAITAIMDKKIPGAVKKYEKIEGKLSKTEQNKIAKAVKLLDQAYGLLYDVIE